MNLRKFKIYLTFCPLIIAAGCVDRKYDCSSTKRYLKEVHSINVDSVDNLMVLIQNMNGCEPCLSAHAKQLRKLPDANNLLMVVVGKNQNSIIINDYQNVLPKFNTYFDEKSRIYNYPTAFGKPLILHFKKGNCILSKEISDYKIIDTYSYIRQNL